MITKINKGDKFVCIKDVNMNDDPAQNRFEAGKIYKSEKRGCLTNEKGSKDHEIMEKIDDGVFVNQHFIPHTYEAVWERYKAAKDMSEAESYMKLLRDLEASVGRSTAGGGNYLTPMVALPIYYDNSKGSLYQIAQQRGWSPYTFDVVKRLDRGGKKDPLEQEIRKSIGVLELWLKEIGGTNAD